MTTPPHDQTPPSDAIEAIDALAQLRGDIARMRARERALCDEIRTLADRQQEARLRGAGHFARIETRKPKRLDRAKLPPEILMDPQYLTEAAETVVFVWPAAAEGTAANTGEIADVAPPDAAEMASSEPVPEPATAEFARHEAEDSDISCDSGADEAADETDPQPAPFRPAPDRLAQPAGDPFGLIAMPEEARPEMPAAEDTVALVDEEARTGETILTLANDDTPADLRPTAQAELQPMAGLQEEEIAQALADTDAPLSLATDPEAMDIAEQLEEMADLHTENPNIFAAPAAFSSRRVATGTDDTPER